jgi:hypothetical protein
VKILLGLTGSVATTLAPKIVKSLQKICDEVVVVMTDKAKCFYNPVELKHKCGVKIYTDEDEWAFPSREIDNIVVETDIWRKGDPVLHIDLAKDACALVIAPATMNTIAKMANGITDNLLTSLFAAWDNNRPITIAPAMNSRMLYSKANISNIACLESSLKNCAFVSPIEKQLACGEFGVGALANIQDITQTVKRALTWKFPLNINDCSGIPVGTHPGSFGAFRSHGKRHCGVDLYVPLDKEFHPVFAVESGVIVDISNFTGPSAGSPWWNDTKCVKVEGGSGVVCYGEIMLDSFDSTIKIGSEIKRGTVVGFVKQVLKDDQLRPDIPGHSLSMLHLQLYKHGFIHKDKSWTQENDNPPESVLDPTRFLFDAFLQSGKQINELN